MRILLTGATGFVGKHLLLHLKKYDVISLGRSKPEGFPKDTFIEKYSNDKEIRPKFRENAYNYYTKYGTAKYLQDRWLDVFKEIDV